ncbi:MAG: hypothetical protein ACOC2Q_03740, partial [Spirochaetota bacterium]
MRNVPRILLVVVFIAFAFALTRSVTTMVSLTQAVATRTGAGEPRTHHVAVFLPEQDTRFFQELKNGVVAVADDYDIALSFHPIGPDA